MFGSRRWLRELERRDRAASEERARLIETICLLAGRPLAPSEMDLFHVETRERAQRAAAELDDDLVDPTELPD